MDVDPFFIVGSERSGTTMLRLMLNEHSRLFIPPESHFLEGLVRKFPRSKPVSDGELDQMISEVVSSRRWQDWGEDPEALKQYLKDKNVQTLPDLIDSVFRFCSGCDDSMRWGDKTPKYVYSINEIAETYPRARFIHIVRDGRDVCVSMLNTQWLGGSIRQISEHWCSATQAASDAELLLGEDRYLQISYEDLVCHSESALKKVCGFIGEEYQSNMLEFYKNTEGKVADRSKKYHTKTTKKPSPEDIGRWSRELPISKVLVYEAQAGPQLHKYGYHLKFDGPFRVLPWMMRWIFHMAEITLPWRNKLGIHFPKISKNY